LLAGPGSVSDLDQVLPAIAAMPRGQISEKPLERL